MSARLPSSSCSPLPRDRRGGGRLHARRSTRSRWRTARTTRPRPGCAPSPWPATSHGANSDPVAGQPPHRHHRDAPARAGAELPERRLGRQRARRPRRGRWRRSRRARATTATPTPAAPPVPALRDREGRRPDRRAPARPAGPTRRARCCRPRPPASSTRWRCSRRSSPISTTFPTRTRRRASLSLCELFEQGVVNEVWIQDGEAGVRRAPLSLERKQSYDGTETAVPGSFAPNAGGGGVARRHHLRRHRPPRAPRRRARPGLRSRGARLGDRIDVGRAARRCAPTRSRS